MSETKTCTITLTDRPPVRIRECDWPIVASAWKTALYVRQHADGRRIVYGVYDYTTAFTHERGCCVKAGALLDPGEDVVEAIRRIGSTLWRSAESGAKPAAKMIDEAVRECIADLPAEEL